MAIQYAYSTNAYTGTGLLDAIRRIGELGFDGVEILADYPHWLPGHDWAPSVEEIQAALSQAGLAVSNINSNTARGLIGTSVDAADVGPTFLDPDASVREARMKHIQRCIDLGEVLGAPVSITTGPLPSGLSPEGACMHCRESLREILNYATGRNVKIGIEYEPGFYIEDADALNSVLVEHNHPLLGANYDIGHAVVAHENPVEGIERFQHCIWNLHVEDIRGDVHEHLPPGEGDIDFHAIVAKLRQVGYQGFLTLELYTQAHRPDEAGAAGLEVLQGIVNATV